ncbi:hypothetical protein [Sorangium sp. So ce204]|uniref:hypothetical protein n=1 Tax=Sorangium sp. So ce204 TaxID=3133288 RepID=UPI003F5DF4BD
MEIENLTESFQRHLGLQQAQTVTGENITADAIARLYNQRSDLGRLTQLWRDDRGDVIVGWSEHRDEYEAALAALTRVIEQGFVTRHKSSGQPHAFLPLSPALITRDQPDVVFRQQGLSVLRVLWSDEGLRERIQRRVDGWQAQHPIAQLLVPLGRVEPLRERGNPVSNLEMAVANDPALREWVRGVVLEDWEAWLAAAARLSADEQFSTMNALICLHLHVALLFRLRPKGEGRTANPPLLFGSAARGAGSNDADRAARNVFDWWADRAHVELREVARGAVDRVAQQSVAHRDTLQATSWDLVRTWGIDIAGKATTVSRAWQNILREAIDPRAASGARPADGEVHEVLSDALVRAFTRGSSSVVSKVRDFLRVTGTAAGIVGSHRTLGRKQYLLGDRFLELIARLHAARSEVTVRTTHEEPASLEALIDDVFARYGIVISADREGVRTAIADLEGGQALRALRKRLPSDGTMHENGQEFERRLDELRLLRRYSDASTLVRVP